jgi:hexosaminidase
VGWKKTKLALIDEAKRPSGIVRFTFIEPLVLLVEAVRER